MAMKMLFAAAALMLATGAEACTEKCKLEHDFVTVLGLRYEAGEELAGSCNCPWETADCGDIIEKLQRHETPYCSLGPASIAMIVIGAVLLIAGIVACAYCCCCREGGCCRSSKNTEPAVIVQQSEPVQAQPAYPQQQPVQAQPMYPQQQPVYPQQQMAPMPDQGKTV